MRRALPLLVLLLGAACGEDFKPVTLVDGLRVLGVRALPPQLAPGETALLQGLVVDPSRPGLANTVAWIGCDPDPFNLNRSACSDPAVLQDPSQLGGGDRTPPPGVRLVGLNAAAAYTAPAGLFDVLPPGDPRRELGTTGQVLAWAIAEEVSPAASEEELRALFERVKTKEVAALMSLFRLPITESPQRNTNPEVAAFLLDGEAWPPGAALLFEVGRDVTLDVDVADAALETYTQLDGDLVRHDKVERILTAWYSTSGRFTEDRTTVREGVKTVFTPPGVDPKDPLPPSRKGTLYVVLRDTRGGQSWQVRPFFLCDASRPTPKVTAVRPGATRADPVVVEGENLSELVDVLLGGQALSRGVFSPQANTWAGELGAIPAGPQAVTVHTTACARLDLGLSVAVP